MATLANQLEIRVDEANSSSVNSSTECPQSKEDAQSKVCYYTIGQELAALAINDKIIFDLADSAYVGFSSSGLSSKIAEIAEALKVNVKLVHVELPENGTWNDFFLKRHNYSKDWLA